MRLKDRVAIVTGSASGIGRSTALLLASEGASVVVADLDGPGAEKVVAEIEAAGREGARSGRRRFQGRRGARDDRRRRGHLGWTRHPAQQRRSARPGEPRSRHGRGVDGRRDLGPYDGRQPPRRDARLQTRDSRDARARRWRDRQYELGLCTTRRSRDSRLCRLEGRRRYADPVRGHAIRQAGDPL